MMGIGWAADWLGRAASSEIEQRGGERAPTGGTPQGRADHRLPAPPPFTPEMMRESAVNGPSGPSASMRLV